MEELGRLKEIAMRNPAIIKMWFFGSRLKGNHRQNSDLDIAIKMEKIDGLDIPVTECIFDENKLILATFENEMRNSVAYHLDLQPYIDSSLTPYIHKYLQERSMIFYERT